MLHMDLIFFLMSATLYGFYGRCSLLKINCSGLSVNFLDCKSFAPGSR